MADSFYSELLLRDDFLNRNLMEALIVEYIDSERAGYYHKFKYKQITLIMF